MAVDSLILSETQARNARNALSEIEGTLSSAEELDLLLKGLPQKIVPNVTRALKTERAHIHDALEAYDKALHGDVAPLMALGDVDQGTMLIVGRLRLGLSQKELARRLGMRMQQVQRYEKERYRSISLANYRKVAAVVGVRPQSELLDKPRSGWVGAKDISGEEARKVVRHARNHGWIERDDESVEDGLAQLKKNIAEHVVQYSTPSMLRTGLNVKEDVVDDWTLLAWKAQVTRIAEKIIDTSDVEYTPIDVAWLPQLVRLSSEANGPRLATDFLLQRGIVLVIEPAIPGLPVDGAAFVINGVPVIGLTIRFDRVDNFWFTLLHELGHVVLHYRTGLATGFFDDTKHPSRDSLEIEANEFAGEILLPEHIWKRSPARIANKPEPIKSFANAMGIHPAIVFGKIRNERNRHDIFSQHVGQGGVRKHFEAFTE